MQADVLSVTLFNFSKSLSSRWFSARVQQTRARHQVHRHNLGTARLMMNDLFVPPEEVQDLNIFDRISVEIDLESFMPSG